VSVLFHPMLGSTNKKVRLFNPLRKKLGFCIF